MKHKVYTIPVDENNKNNNNNNSSNNLFASNQESKLQIQLKLDQSQDIVTGNAHVSS